MVQEGKGGQAHEGWGQKEEVETGEDNMPQLWQEGIFPVQLQEVKEGQREQQ